MTESETPEILDDELLDDHDRRLVAEMDERPIYGAKEEQEELKEAA